VKMHKTRFIRRKGRNQKKKWVKNTESECNFLEQHDKFMRIIRKINELGVRSERGVDRKKY